MHKSLVFAVGLVFATACSKSTPPEPTPESTSTNGAVANPVETPTPSAAAAHPAVEGENHADASATAAPAASSVVAMSGSDPLAGKFGLPEATEGISGTGSLVAKIQTNLGALSCKLFDDKAPVTVANFVGLARGIRPWRMRNGVWIKQAAYDGTPFHRIIKGFMIQGGDQNGNGTGEPGYTVIDELWSGAKHDRPGLLCMANRGPNTNGAQFFITDAAAPHLDKSYTIFGECSPVDLVHKIASVKVNGERPVDAVTIQTVTVAREKPAAK
jgi:peptidyl-prolyl cis-trans isomerase A (cyclophilin A)